MKSWIRICESTVFLHRPKDEWSQLTIYGSYRNRPVARGQGDFAPQLSKFAPPSWTWGSSEKKVVKKFYVVDPDACPPGVKFAPPPSSKFLATGLYRKITFLQPETI
jgi:hypothetical protein